jgi:hypothetical protein
MSGQEIKKITVHPIAGIDFQMVPQGVAVTIRYYGQDGTDVATSSMQSLTVGLTAAQALDVAGSLQRAAQMIQSRADSKN